MSFVCDDIKELALAKHWLSVAARELLGNSSVDDWDSTDLLAKSGVEGRAPAWFLEEEAWVVTVLTLDFVVPKKREENDFFNLFLEFGEGVPYGTIYAINPALIMILVPIMTAATSHVEPLTMIHVGSYVSSISVFFLAISTSIPACVLFVITLSIGEAIWSPRLNDYTMSVSEEGREGTYMALSSAPLLLAKLPVGFLSGYLLQQYCPPEGQRRSKFMWLIIGVTTATSPILMTIFWRFISHKDTSIVDHSTGSDRIDSPTLNRHHYTELAPNTNNLPQPD